MTLGAQLGRGAFATVFAAQLEGSTSRVVVKRLARAAVDAGHQVRRLQHTWCCRFDAAATQQCGLHADHHIAACCLAAAPRARAQAANEVAMLLRAGRHPNLVAWHGWYMDASGRLCLLLQRCEGGCLDGLLKVRQHVPLLMTAGPAAHARVLLL